MRHKIFRYRIVGDKTKQKITMAKKRGRHIACYSANLFYFAEQKAILALQVTNGTDSESDLRSVFIEFRDKPGMLIAE
jgi:hypothetical protein